MTSRIVRAVGASSTMQAARSRQLVALPSARAIYGNRFADGFEYAARGGYAPRYGADATPNHPASDGTMNRIAKALAPYAAVIDRLYVTEMTRETGGKVDAIYSLVAGGAPAMIPTTGLGGVLAVDAVGRPAVNMNGQAAASGYRALLDPSRVSVRPTSGGRTVIHVGRMTARPAANSSARLAGVTSNSVPLLCVGTVPGGTKWRVQGRRATTVAATEVIADSGVDSIVGSTFVLAAIGSYDAATVQLLVNGEVAIAPTAWGAGEASIYAASTSANYAEMAYMNTGYAGSCYLFAELNTADTAIVTAVSNILKAAYSIA